MRTLRCNVYIKIRILSLMLTHSLRVPAKTQCCSKASKEHHSLHALACAVQGHPIQKRTFTHARTGGRLKQLPATVVVCSKSATLFEWHVRCLSPFA